MPKADKDKYTDKQKRQAEHIEEGYEKKGVSEVEAEKRAWATINKQDGGNKSGAGRKNSAQPFHKRLQIQNLMPFFVGFDCFINPIEKLQTEKI